MKSLATITRKLTLYITTALLIGMYPLTALAEEAATVPETPPEKTYTYDPVTKHWSSNEWYYNPETNKYEPVMVPVAESEVPPAIAATEAETETPTVNSDTTVEENTNNQLDVTHDVGSTAITGDATVQNNNTAGDATSGDALAISTIMNNINSISSLGGGAPYVFSQDIYGDVYGDIEIAPQLLQAMAQATGDQGGAGNQTLKYNTVNDTNLTNNVDLAAASGDASVLSNTHAGSATSGNATAIANILNVVNSVIAANQSFVGTINIHGNLDGDILMSRDGSPSLLASNSTDSSAPFSQGQLIANQYNLTDIVNNVELGATSGDAHVKRNTNAGNALSGDAETNLVIMNLTGYNVVAKNSLLVFVNVLGKWVGIIVDAPTGATAAVLGDDVTSSLIAAQIGDSESDVTIDTENKTQITNNVKVGATTGDANVQNNTHAGNATSGDAKAAATILNMANSAFAVSDWFGVLFINVLGSWYGSFGVDTEQGGTATASETPGSPNGAQTGSAQYNGVAQVFRFVNHAVSGGQSSAEGQASAEQQELNTAVLAASKKAVTSPVSMLAENLPTTISMPIAIGGLAVFGGAVFLTIRLLGSLRGRFNA